MAPLSSRYARAFVDVVLAHKLDLAKTDGDLSQIVTLMESSPDLRRAWSSPSIASKQKLKLLDAISAQAGLSLQLRNFIAVLIVKRRIGALEEIVQLYKSDLNDRMGFAEAAVTSARELGTDERGNLESQLARLTGKTVRASYGRDPQVLGGAVIKVGSTIYDGSVRRRLQKIKQQMTS